MKTAITVLVSLFLSTAQGSPAPKAPTSLESQAQSEISTLTSGAKKAESSQSTDAILPAESLSLKDEFKSPRARDYDFGFSLSLRPHQVKGTGSIPAAGTYNLTAGNSWMPVLGLGIEKNFVTTPGTFSEVRLGINGNVGFISQEMQVAFQNQLTSVRLNSTSTEVEGFAEVSLARAPRLGFGASYGVSQLSVTQTGSASLSQWTKQLRQNFSGVFANYRFNPRWSGQLALLSRSNLTSGQTDLRQDRSLYQAGFKVIW